MIPFEKISRSVWAGAVVLLVSAGFALADDAKPISFDENVAAIFKRHCLQCHGESKQKAGLDLSSYPSVIKGSTGGPIVVAGRSSASRIIQAITAEDPAERMPPDNDALTREQVATIRSWIDGGLRQNSGSVAASTTSVGFKPSSMPKFDAIGPMPDRLPAIDRPKTLRPFPILALAASPRASLVAAAGYESIDLINPTTRAVLGSLPFPPGEPHVLRFSRSGAVLLAAGGRPVQNGSAVLFDVKTGKRLAEFGDETDVVIAADLSPDERRVAVGGSGRVVKVFSTENGKLIQTLIKHTDWVTSIAYSPDGKLLATGDRIGNIHLWDAVGGGVVLPLAEHKGAIRSLAWRTDSQVLASCGEDGLVVWWDVAKGWPSITKPDAHPPARPPGVFGKIANGVLDATFGPGGELVTCGRDNTVRLWADDGRELNQFSIEGEAATGTQPPNGLRILPTRAVLSFDGSQIIAGDTGGRIHSWPINATQKR